MRGEKQNICTHIHAHQLYLFSCGTYSATSPYYSVQIKEVLTVIRNGGVSKTRCLNVLIDRDQDKPGVHPPTHQWEYSMHSSYQLSRDVQTELVNPQSRKRMSEGGYDRCQEKHQWFGDK